MEHWNYWMHLHFLKADSFGAKMRIVFPKEIIIEN